MEHLSSAGSRRIPSGVAVKFRKKVLVVTVVVTLCNASSLCLAQCFGGVETYEKTSGATFATSGNVQGLLSQPGTAVTRDCAALCKQTSNCAAFNVDYTASRCQSVDQDFVRRKDALKETSGVNYFEKVCLRGVTNFNTLCGDRLWAFERVIGASLQGFDDREEVNVQSRADCQKQCLEQNEFICRSAEYDATQQICRLSREDRRTQPLAFRKDGGSVDYLENQCVRTLPDCRYAARNDASLFSMDQVEFAQSQSECESLCDQARAFHCRAYSFITDENRCYLSGDDSVSLLSVQLRTPQGPVNSRQKSVYAEKICSISQCDNGIFTFEKVTGHILRSARQEPLSLTNSRNVGTDSMTGGVTVDCGKACLEIGADCPAFNVDYNQGRCFKLDRNSQGRAEELTVREGNSYFEKICLRGNVAMCRDRAWAFDRIPGKELRGLDDRVLPLVATRRDCQEACLQETQFSCRSAEYDTKTLDCKLSSADRRSRPEAYVDASVNTEYLENQCVQLESTCTFQTVENAYPRYLDAIVSNIQDEKLCSSTCTSHRPFICRAYSYYQSGSQCFLSGDDRVSATTSALQSRQGTNYTEKKCSSTSISSSSSFFNSGPGLAQGPSGSVPSSSGSGGFNSVFSSTWLSGSSFNSNNPGAFTFRSPSSTVGGFQSGFNSFGTFSTVPAFSAQDRCRGGKTHFQRITGYEMIAGSSSRDSSSVRSYPMNVNGRGSAVLADCLNQCGFDSRCMAVNYDTRRQSCAGIEGDWNLAGLSAKNSSLLMRRSSGIVAYEVNCFRVATCSSQWSTERWPGYDLRGFDREIIRGLSRSECTERCLEERRFNCRSAMYESNRQECRLSSEDRFTQPRSFQANPDFEYIENQCAPDSRQCRYSAVQPDKSVVYVDKSIPASSESACQDACQSERTFRCRSISMQRDPRGSNLCLMSSSTSAIPDSTQFQRGSLYMERSCDPSVPSPDVRPSITNEIFPTTNRNPGPPLSAADSYSGWTSLSSGGKTGSSSNYPPPPRVNYPPTGLHSGPLIPDIPQHNRFPNDPLYEDRYSGGRIRPGSFDSGSAVFTSTSLGFNSAYDGQFGSNLGGSEPWRCRGATSFDKVAHADYAGARRQEIRLSSDGSFTLDCLRECERMGERCLAVVMETDRSSRHLFSRSGPSPNRQKCYVLDRSASMDSASLLYSSQSMYFEKTCLPEATCGKAWSFVRVHGYELEGFDNQILRNVATKEECQAACIRMPNGQCRSAEYFPRERTCHISTEDRRTQIRRFRSSASDAIYMENQCATEPPHCEYTDQEGRTSPWFDRAVSLDARATAGPPSSLLAECRRLCDTERGFLCKSVSMQLSRPMCYLSADDSVSLNGINGANALMPDRDFIFSERASCNNVRVECTQADIIVTLSFGQGFSGRVYASGNPQACFEMGSGRDQMVLRIPLGNQCGTIQQSPGRYANHIVIQQNAIIMQESDRTVRVECSFDAAEQTVTFAQSSGQRVGGLHYPGVGGIDVTAPFRPGNLNIVTNTAPTPAVRMRITSRNGEEARVVGLGELLTLRIEVDPLSAFGITARNVEARTDNGELLTLIEATGCPRDSNIFPALSMDRGSKSLFADFKAFRFPSTATVNFVATVTFCQESCQPIRCPEGMESYGRRRRDANTTFVDSTTPLPTTEESEFSTIVSTTFAPIDASTTVDEDSEPEETNGRLLKHSSGIPPLTEVTKTAPESVSPTTTSSPAPVEIATEDPAGNKPLPIDIPLHLQLIVGPEAVPSKPQSSPVFRSKESSYLSSDPVVDQQTRQILEHVDCNTKSVVIAVVLVSVLVNVGLVAGFVVFYRKKSAHWSKLRNLTNQNAGTTNVVQSGTLSEVTFRSVYDKKPGTWNTLNMAFGNNRRCHVASVFAQK